MHYFEVMIRICQPKHSGVHRGEAEVNITFKVVFTRCHHVISTRYVVNTSYHHVISSFFVVSTKRHHLISTCYYVFARCFYVITIPIICVLCLVFLMLSRLSIAALWSPAGKGLTSWLLLVIPMHPFRLHCTPQGIFSWVPTCSLGPPECLTKLS